MGMMATQGHFYPIRSGDTAEKDAEILFPHVALMSGGSPQPQTR